MASTGDGVVVVNVVAVGVVLVAVVVGRGSSLPLLDGAAGSESDSDSASGVVVVAGEGPVLRGERSEGSVAYEAEGSEWNRSWAASRRA